MRSQDDLSRDGSFSCAGSAIQCLVIRYDTVLVSGWTKLAVYTTLLDHGWIAPAQELA
jgi:hypothetical protein